jgi:benzodiazapine receptor
METLMLERGREIVEDLLNAEGRSGGHVALGIVLLSGVGLTAALLSRQAGDEIDRTGVRTRAPGHGVIERPRSLLGALRPMMLSATTLSAMRVWNAPSAGARSRALGIWGAMQLLNALIIASRPRRFSGQVAGAMASAGLASAYAFEARKLDRRAGTIATPVAGSVGLSHLARDVARRRTRVPA